MPAVPPSVASRRCARAPRWCPPLVVLVVALGCASPAARAATVAEKARESECVGKAEAMGGELFRCATKSGAFAYFNVPGATGTPGGKGGTGRGAASAPTPAGFPRVDVETQKGRDDIRRKVLTDELAAEEKSLADARLLYADGAPLPLPEERNSAERYRERIARLRQTVTVHEKNVEALKKELAGK
jgi:hypothetical protein